MSWTPQTYSLETYLQNVEDRDICPDADTQRDYHRRSNEWQDNLVKTIYHPKFNYIPVIELSEEFVNGKKKKRILNGLHRTMTLWEFRKGKHRISKTMKNSIITYLKKRVDEDGNFVLDENGDFYFDETEYDLRGKCYDDFPPEMKKTFNEYQLSTIIFENCTKEDQAEWVIILNEQNPMNAAQKALTYTSNYAKKIKTIAKESRFFKDCGVYTQTQRENGTLERVVSECVMASFYLDDWKKDSKGNASYINDNATEDNFEKVADYLSRLTPLCENEIGKDKRFQNIFSSKNTFLFVALFNKFTQLGLEDNRYVDFLINLETDLHGKEINGETWDSLDTENGTKAKSLVERKMVFLEKLMMDYLHINKEEIQSEDISVMDFVKEIISENITEEDIADYEGDLEIITLDVDNDSKLLNKNNHNSLIAMVAYGYKEDVSAEIHEWLVDYFGRNNTYFVNQNKNYLHMLDDFKKYLSENAA